MTPEEVKISDREKIEESARQLKRLREKLLHAADTSKARRAAFNLSWMQEDGLDILKGAVFENTPRITKSAAAYGLRKMNGRMKKMALEVLEEGLRSPDKGTKVVCRRALDLLSGKVKPKPIYKSRRIRPKFVINEVHGNRKETGSIRRKW